jgi:hypothetical protein
VSNVLLLILLIKGNTIQNISKSSLYRIISTFLFIYFSVYWTLYNLSSHKFYLKKLPIKLCPSKHPVLVDIEGITTYNSER